MTKLAYVPGRPVRISVRQRERRYDIDDTGAAVAIAGRPPGWRVAAERAVEAFGSNINRDGVVFMQAVEGRDIDALVQRTAEASAAVHDAILEIEECRQPGGHKARSFTAFTVPRHLHIRRRSDGRIGQLANSWVGAATLENGESRDRSPRCGPAPASPTAPGD